MICKIGWQFLSTCNKSDGGKIQPDKTETDYSFIESKLFYPISFPITTGPGTVSVLFTLSVHSACTGINSYLVSMGTILLSIILMCVLVYIFKKNYPLFGVKWRRGYQPDYCLSDILCRVTNCKLRYNYFEQRIKTHLGTMNNLLKI